MTPHTQNGQNRTQIRSVPQWRTVFHVWLTSLRSSWQRKELERKREEVSDRDAPQQIATQCWNQNSWSQIGKKGTYRRIYVGFVRPLANILVRHIEFVRSLALSVVRQTRSICILWIVLMSLCSSNGLMSLCPYQFMSMSLFLTLCLYVFLVIM